MKREITETVSKEIFDPFILDQYSIDEAIEYLTEVKDKLRQAGYTDHFIDIDSGGFTDGFEITIEGKRDETEEEYDFRIQREKNRVEREEEKERAEYERLKAKFDAS